MECDVEPDKSERPALQWAGLKGLGRLSSRNGNPRILFVQATDPGAYPPLIHASTLMADAGWDVTFLSSPIAGNRLAMPSHPRVTVREVRVRPSHVMSNVNYSIYATTAAGLALGLRPDVVYASDPLGAGPGLLAARLTGARLVYHEHDSPQPGTLHPILARLRAAAMRSARLIVFPNDARARVAQTELRFADDRLHIVWNVPRRAELAASTATAELPLIVYYHGSITPERLPETVAFAVRRMAGRVRLRIAGYEAPGARGYVRHVVGSDAGVAADALVEYIGMVPRADLLAQAARAHVGLSLMPFNSGELNMSHMAGASNKPFDYMAAGLALLVSDLPDWTRIFVEPGFGLACNPTDVDSLSAALGWFIDYPERRRVMAARARNKIEAEWNYDTQFRAVLDSLESTYSNIARPNEHRGR
jgi:glycosyltransferase involved in cell wall biosynthesis